MATWTNVSRPSTSFSNQSKSASPTYTNQQRTATTVIIPEGMPYPFASLAITYAVTIMYSSGITYTKQSKS